MHELCPNYQRFIQFKTRVTLLLYTKGSGYIAHTAQEIDNICRPFLLSRGLSYFQFKRVYVNHSYIILANRPEFFMDFLEVSFRESPPYVSPYTRLSAIYFWDESLPDAQLAYLNEKKGIYHGMTLIFRRKYFYDCTTFARTQPHPSPVAYYFDILRELQKFTDVFPIRGRLLIEKATKYHVKGSSSKQPEKGIDRKGFFLPKRSVRFPIGEDTDYITTYEALCVQLLDEGKTYKEIGSILSVAPSTVKMHLKRLRARTGLSIQEIILHSFYPPNNDGSNLENAEQNYPVTTKKKVDII